MVLTQEEINNWEESEAYYSGSDYQVDMTPLDRQDDGTVVFREDGKVLKNENAPKCDLSNLI